MKPRALHSQALKLQASAAIIALMAKDSARYISRLLPLLMMLAVSACGWAEFPSSRGGPTTNAYGGNADAFINATAVRVGPGDTVYSIARRHKLSPRDIIEANNLRPPYALTQGQRLVLPAGRVHVVARGEYLALIAKRYGTDAYAIARINGVRAPYTIYPGQKLRIPRTGSGEVRFTDAPARNAPGQDVTVAELPPPSELPPSPDSPVTPTRTAEAARSSQAEVPEPPKRSGGKFGWPLQGKIISGYGPKDKGLHNDGINIAAAKGTPVHAAENGVVAYAGNEIRGFGNLLLIKHDGGWVTAYAHNDELLVKRGDKVTRGQVISKVGSTGSVTSPQLHFELRQGSDAVDPGKYM